MGIAVDEMAVASRLLAHRREPSKRRWLLFLPQDEAPSPGSPLKRRATLSHEGRGEEPVAS
jgi:hypothetical protein